ncbi:MAG: hypothetical protein H7138_20930 [Myxococcales bacterium]|nr:hypothetical protein [Myxococcales bacterium]
MLVRHRSSHDARLSEVRAQATDANWSTATQAHLQSELAKRGAQVASVDCRSTACVATLEWSSRAQAQAEYRHLIEPDGELPCDRQIFLDRAEREDVPYRATLVVDCAHVRAHPSL